MLSTGQLSFLNSQANRSIMILVIFIIALEILDFVFSILLFSVKQKVSMPLFGYSRLSGCFNTLFWVNFSLQQVVFAEDWS